MMYVALYDDDNDIEGDMPGANSVLSKVKADSNDHEESSSGGTSPSCVATKKARA